MTEPVDPEIQRWLQQAIPPVHEHELRHDLWQPMLRKLGEGHAGVTWFDWTLIVLAIVILFSSPGVLPVLLYFL